MKKYLPFILIIISMSIYAMAIRYNCIANSKDDGGLGGLNETMQSLFYMALGFLFTLVVPIVIRLTKSNTFNGFFLVWFVIPVLSFFVFLQTL